MQPLAGPGQGLPPPQSLYPTNLLPNGEFVPPTNYISLSSGQCLPVPRGSWAISAGDYGELQQLDPVTQTWRGVSSIRKATVNVLSDGFNTRVANLTGCAIGAIVTVAGSGYVQGSTTVTPSAGNSTWQPIIGGLVSTTVSITGAGSGYTIPPIVSIAAPPPPGVAATAIAVLSSGTVSSITVINQGAGYPTAPAITLSPDPYDPAFLSGSITVNATAVTTVVGSGTLAAVLCTNAGESFATVPSLTIAGAGTSAAATIVPMWTLSTISITSGGVGYSANVLFTTVGGQPSATPAHTNPAIELTGYIPRPAQGYLTSNGGVIATINAVYDTGLYAGTPIGVLIDSTGAGATTVSTIALTLGTANVTVAMQNLG